jgi:predicted nucleotidyltransferase
MKKDFWIEKFINEALPKLILQFKPTKVVIFGSRISGTPHENSDIDVIIVSKYFENIPFLRRMPLVIKTMRFPKHIDFICYTEEEFERINSRSSLVMSALKDGIEVAL